MTSALVAFHMTLILATSSPLIFVCDCTGFLSFLSPFSPSRWFLRLPGWAVVRHDLAEGDGDLDGTSDLNVGTED